MSPEKENEDEELYRNANQKKITVHERDQFTCIQCRESFEDGSNLDVDHIVARGKGGSNTIRNLATACRRCHEAKHGERDHAPTVRFLSTGDMVNKDFYWFRHLWQEIVPAVSEVAFDFRVKPVFNIAEEKAYQAWHIPLGDVRRLDELLSQKENITYSPMKMHHYM